MRTQVKLDESLPSVVLFMDDDGRVTDCWADAQINVVVLTPPRNSGQDAGEGVVTVHGQQWVADARRLGRLRDTPHVLRPKAVADVIEKLVAQTEQAQSPKEKSHA